MKTGKLGEVDLTKNDCPLAEKCPYYKDFKKNPSKLKDCPVHGCPHFEGHHEHGIKHDDVAKCPHFKGGKGKAGAKSDDNEKDTFRDEL